MIHLSVVCENCGASDDTGPCVRHMGSDIMMFCGGHDFVLRQEVKA